MCRTGQHARTQTDTEREFEDMKKFLDGCKPKNTDPHFLAETPECVKSLKEAADKISEAHAKLGNDASRYMDAVREVFGYSNDSSEPDPDEHYCHMSSMIKSLVAEELAAANQRYPLFSSQHEAYAVTKEELEEALEDLCETKKLLNIVWDKIRKNDDCTQEFRVMMHTAMHAAYESIQIAAMCQKAIDSEEERHAEDR